MSHFQNTYFLTSGFEIYAIWVQRLVNKLSQIPDVNRQGKKQTRELN